jgi:hypothetical protein
MQVERKERAGAGTVPAPSAPPDGAVPPPPAPADLAQAPPSAAASRLEAEQDTAAPAPEKRALAEAPRVRSDDRKGQVAGAAAEDAIARHARLQLAGQLHATAAEFRDCPAESSREVEQDAGGRVVKVTRRGLLHGRPFQVEQFYGEDGLLGAVRYSANGAIQELRFGALGAAAASTVGGVPASVLTPRRAADAGLDAPPRCED